VSIDWTTRNENKVSRLARLTAEADARIAKAAEADARIAKAAEAARAKRQIIKDAVKAKRHARRRSLRSNRRGPGP
jgi:hypothetical protein